MHNKCNQSIMFVHFLLQVLRCETELAYTTYVYLWNNLRVSMEQLTCIYGTTYVHLWNNLRVSLEHLTCIYGTTYVYPWNILGVNWNDLRVSLELLTCNSGTTLTFQATVKINDHYNMFSYTLFSIILSFDKSHEMLNDG